MSSIYVRLNGVVVRSGAATIARLPGDRLGNLRCTQRIPALCRPSFAARAANVVRSRSRRSLAEQQESGFSPPNPPALRRQRQDIVEFADDLARLRGSSEGASGVARQSRPK